MAQTYRLSPRVLAMLGTFQMSTAELESWLANESDKNIMLQVQKPQPTQVASDDYAPVIKNPDETLQAVLVRQLETLDLAEPDHAIGMMLVDAIQPDGYLSDYAGVVQAIQAAYSTTEAAIQGLLDRIQCFEPSGVGARSLQECLLIQLDQNPSDMPVLDDMLRDVITNHLDLFADDAVLTGTDFDADQIQALRTYISRHFHPKPGLQYASEASPALRPAFYVSFTNTGIALQNLEQASRVHVGISHEYAAVLHDPNTPPESRAFLQDLYDRAKTIINQVEARWARLSELVTHIATVQQPYLTQASPYLRPLQQSALAEKLGVSPSTLSRLVNAKSIETKHGVYLLRTLCPRSYFGRTKAQLEAIIRTYCSDYPQYSDQKLAQQLAKDLGITIARRTVASYRQKLGLLSGYKRKTQRLS